MEVSNGNALSDQIAKSIERALVKALSTCKEQRIQRVLNPFRRLERSKTLPEVPFRGLDPKISEYFEAGLDRAVKRSVGHSELFNGAIEVVSKSPPPQTIVLAANAYNVDCAMGFGNRAYLER